MISEAMQKVGKEGVITVASVLHRGPRPTVREQLVRAGVRLAGLLDRALEN